MPTESGSDIFKLHDIVDNAERRLRQELGCDATIHLDPVAAEDEQTQMLHERMEAALFEINSGLTMHDFRIVPGPTHTNLIFDITVPFRYEGTESLPAELQRRLQAIDPHLYVVAQAEHSYI